MPDDPATIATYEQAHRVGHTPPAVLDMQRRHGIADLEIFRADNRLVMLMHVTEAFDPAGIEAESASNPVLIAWHRQMGRCSGRPLPMDETGRKLCGFFASPITTS